MTTVLRNHNDYLISDMHKDAYGYRPSLDLLQWCNTCSQEEFDLFRARLAEAVEDEIARERSTEEAAEAAFEQLIDATISYGAGDRATAVRWILEAEGWKQGSPDQELGFAMWKCGINRIEYVREIGRLLNINYLEY